MSGWLDRLQALQTNPPTAARSAAEAILPASSTADLLPANPPLPASLIKAAMDLCESYGDNANQREQMKDELQDYPPESWPWLESYFIETSVRMDMERIKPMVKCADCRHASINSGIARCAAGVESGLPIAAFWASDRHLCASYEAKP